MKINMTYTRETVHKVVSDENVEEPKLGSLYITRDAFDELGKPKEIVVEIISKESK
jgi:hypothetical protein